MVFKKKLYKFRPKDQARSIETHFTKEQRETVLVNSRTVEREVRQMLAEKISGTYVGLWLLLPEHLRLGTWDLLTAWTGIRHPNAVEPRLAMQMVHESALCLRGVRQQKTLRQKGFETLHGLPFVATDQAIHQLLDEHTLAEAESLQLALGQLRQARGHYPGKLILLDPHRIKTWSQRQMPPRKAGRSQAAKKMMQTFFGIDGESGQPLGFGIASSSVTITQATLPLVERFATILPADVLMMLIGDSEHFTVELLNQLSGHPKFSLLIAVPRRQALMRQVRQMTFKRTWAGYAVAEGDYLLSGPDSLARQAARSRMAPGRTAQRQSLRIIAQRTGETKETYDYKPFVTTSKMPAADLMTEVFPERWNIEEFFNLEAALGWNRAATLNLNIRFGRLSMALIAQAAIYELRKKLPADINNWTAESMARKLFNGIDGDLRVKDDTIIVTFYNAPHESQLRGHYENLPKKLETEGVDPRVPWLYNYKVDFRFK